MYNSSPVGTTILCTIHDVDEQLINNHALLDSICEKALECDGFSVLNKINHEFDPQGYTCVFLLAESHLAIHTYPEFKSISITLYSCRRPDDGKKTIKHLIEKLGNSHSSTTHDIVVKKNQ